jgi:hypothetical protein
MQLAAPPVRVGRGRDGTLTYALALGPEDLPPIPARDLEAAWDAARTVPAGDAVGRAFRFEGKAGPLDLSLRSAAARRWAASVDGVAGLHTCRGVSLCLRVLALVELMARAPGRASLRPALLRAVATARLTADGQLDPASVPGLPRSHDPGAAA